MSKTENVPILLSQPFTWQSMEFLGGAPFSSEKLSCLPAPSVAVKRPKTMLLSEPFDTSCFYSLKSVRSFRRSLDFLSSLWWALGEPF